MDREGIGNKPDLSHTDLLQFTSETVRGKIGSLLSKFHTCGSPGVGILSSILAAKKG